MVRRHQLTQTRPAWIWRGTVYAWWASRVHTPAPRPYTVSFAMATASSSSLKVVTLVTGPKISS